jgi:hypothetical protein
VTNQVYLSSCLIIGLKESSDADIKKEFKIIVTIKQAIEEVDKLRKRIPALQSGKSFKKAFMIIPFLDIGKMRSTSRLYTVN